MQPHKNRPIGRFLLLFFQQRIFAERFSFESFHEQLPLPVPCYDLLPVTELTVNPP
jgi:hypothetical protein